MASLAHALNGLASALAFKYINTGDKLLDTACTGVITYLIAITINYLSEMGYYNIYNYIVYNLLYKDTPYEDIDYRRFYHLPGSIKDKYKYNMLYDKDDPSVFPSSHLPALNKYFSMYTKYDNVHIKYTDQWSAPPPVRPIFITRNGNIVYMTTSSQGCHNKYILLALNEEDTYIAIAYIKNYVKNMPGAGEDTAKYITDYELNSAGNIVSKQIGLVSERKTFDALFYTQKDELVAMLAKFKNGSLYPDTISMDNKLGILLYGPPGTGKTGTISAIANFLGRGICTINLSTPGLTREAINNILSESIYKKNIIVFDEFDCMMDVLTVRNQVEKAAVIEDTAPKTNWAELISAAGPEEKKQIIEMMKEERSKIKKGAGIDLAYLLQKLDGIERVDGRVIIATTNNPDHINPVLLRPGRFDMKLCLGNCTRKMYIDILTSFYKLEKGLLDIYDFPEERFSPLELINMCLTSKGLDEVLSRLNKK